MDCYHALCNKFMNRKKKKKKKKKKSPHSKGNHQNFVGCCKGNMKANPPILPTANGMPCSHTPQCVNCNGLHAANTCACPFWHHCFDHLWIEAKYMDQKERVWGHGHPFCWGRA